MVNQEDWEIHWKDYYKILRIRPPADAKAIESAYRALAKKYHPDINKDSSASERMKDINIAYETLSDPVKRMSYDAIWHQRYDDPVKRQSHHARWQQKYEASKPAASRPATGQFTTATHTSPHLRRFRFHIWGIARSAIKVGAIITVVAILYLKVNACTHKDENDVARYQLGAPYTAIETLQIGGNVTAGPFEVHLDYGESLGLYGDNYVGIGLYYLGDLESFYSLPVHDVNSSTLDHKFYYSINASVLSGNASKIDIYVVANKSSSN